MGSVEVGDGKRIVARLAHGADLIDEILGVAREHHIEQAHCWAIGAVKRARLAYYDQDGKAYWEFALDRHLEIVSLIGNLSLRDGQPVVHAHAAFADDEGAMYGGHVAAGCEIFACELLLVEFSGEILERKHDEVTGLPLWQKLG
jgi:predicted DNA-binding protein with PD1-like motif